MKSLMPVIFRDDETVSPDRMNEVFGGLKRELADTIARRYSYWPVVVPFNAVANADAAGEKLYKFKPPVACDIIGVELYVAGPSDTWSVSCDLDGVDSVSVSSVTGGARATGGGLGHCPADTEVTFTLSQSGLTDATNVVLVIHTRCDRHQGAPPSTFSRPVFSSGVTPDASTVSTALSQVDADLSTDAGNDVELRAVVLSWRNLGASIASTKASQYAPSGGRRLARIAIANAFSGTGSVRVRVYDEGAAQVGFAVSSTSTYALGDSDPDDIQDVDDIDDESDDYVATIDISSGSPTLTRTHVTLYFT